MKHLKVTYGDVVLWDAPVGSLEWHDSDNGIKVEGRVKGAAKGGAGGGLLDMLTSMSKAKTEAKREELAEVVEPELVEEGAV